MKFKMCESKEEFIKNFPKLAKIITDIQRVLLVNDESIFSIHMEKDICKVLIEQGYEIKMSMYY